MEILRVENLSKQYGGLRAVDGVNLSVEKNTIHGLIGPNGAGKTTFFSLISGFETPTAGKIVLDGEDITGKKPYTLCRKGLVRTYQIVKPFKGMSTVDNVMVGSFVNTDHVAAAREKAMDSLRRTKLDHKAGVFAGSLNLCEQKRLEVARALASDPKILLLDEVMAGLTPSEVAEVMEIIVDIKRAGVTIVIIEHIMQAIMSISDTISVLNFGRKIAEGGPKEISTDREVIAAYLGSEFAQ
ncbi:ABC transporter ATP-binding protein [Feifania hominis]|uniref:ABC transporter ATP-binding protein n=1 Tax=Feifania hominis TaxID=2763660 RepID=A0A926DEK6_9FIRM|nr:ABC transporter ATP-binding protein [Feifania hominis]MBC8536396.1 ABC transporter ATP-binding protein [Feifania hominis]